MDNLFVKGWIKQHPLQPWERATLKFVEQVIIAAFSTTILAVAYDLPSHTTIDWLFLAQVSLLVGLLTALVQYFRARGDTLVTKALEQVISDVEARARLPLNPPQ